MKFVYFIPLLIFIITPAFAYNSGFTPVYQPTTPPGGVVSIHDIGNVTSIGCAIGQMLAVNGSAIWACVNAGSGEANTASSSGLGQSLVLPKIGVDLPFKGLAVSGDLTISSNATDITIGHTDGGSGNSTILNDLGDVILTAPSQFSILYYNGINWIDQIFKLNSKTCTAGQFVSDINNQTGAVTCSTPSGSGNMTVLNDGGDVTITSPSALSILYYVGNQWIDKIFSINTQSTSNDVFVTGINNQTGAITTNQFSVNTQSSSVDRQITGINNVTGEITRNTFSVNTKTCSGTDKVSSIDNSTGNVICTTDTSGSGTARESMVATWETDKTWANIGLVFVNTYTTGTGDPFRIDTNGKTTVTLMIDWTKVGTGTQKCKIAVVGSEGTILIMATNLITGINTNATVSIPVAQQNTIANYKPMCLSSTSTDDPVWLNGQVLLR